MTVNYKTLGWILQVTLNMTSCRLGLCYTEKMKCASKCSFKNSSSVNNNSHQKTHESLWFTFKTAGMCVCGCFISDCVVCLA